MATQVNGINLDILSKTVSSIKEDPDLGQCRFHVSNRWINGNRNLSRVEPFYAARQEMQHREPYEAGADEPPILAGDDMAPNPVEHLLMALASCVTTSMVAHAAVRGIEIEELESEIEGDIDLSGFLGLSNEVPRGYQQIRVTLKVKSDADPEQLQRLAEFSPVFNTITNGARVDLNVEKREEAGPEAPEPQPAGVA